MTAQTIFTNYLSIKAERLAMQKKTDELKAREEALFAELKSQLNVDDVVTSGGMIATFVPVRKPEVVDWGELHNYIQGTGNFSLLHNRLTESAVKEIWETGDGVPGVVAHDLYELKVTKIKSK